jgi:chorismate--pyruvate lyase
MALKKLVSNRQGWRLFRPSGLPPDLASWLGEPRSLTRRLRAWSGSLQLILLRQCYARPLPDEFGILSLRRGERVWVREVLLLADGIPVLYAHSIARPAALRSAWRQLKRTGIKPVGDLIFARPGISRGPIHIRRLSVGDRLHGAAAQALADQTEQALQPSAALWARRSPFIHAGHCLWITEVFLPAIVELGKPGRCQRATRGKS